MSSGLKAPFSPLAGPLPGVAEAGRPRFFLTRENLYLPRFTQVRPVAKLAEGAYF